MDQRYQIDQIGQIKDLLRCGRINESIYIWNDMGWNPLIFALGVDRMDLKVLPTKSSNQELTPIVIGNWVAQTLSFIGKSQIFTFWNTAQVELDNELSLVVFGKINPIYLNESIQTTASFGNIIKKVLTLT